MNKNTPPDLPANDAGPTRNIALLRDHLFDQLDRLKTCSNSDEIARAKAVAEVAGRVIESARVEVDFIKQSGMPGSGFLTALPPGMKLGLAHRMGE